MTPSASRKASERQRRKAEGQVEYKGWLSAEDHAALVAMARDAGMTQGQVIARLIGMRATLLNIDRWDQWGGNLVSNAHGDWVLYDDLGSALGWGK